MKPVAKPTIATLRPSRALDALSAHASGAIRVACAVLVANVQPPPHGTRLPEFLAKLDRGCQLLAEREPEAKDLIAHTRAQVQLLRDTVVAEGLYDASMDVPIEGWIRSHLRYGALLEVPTDDEASLTAFAAAYVFGQFKGTAIAVPFARKLIQESASPLASALRSDVRPPRWMPQHERHVAELKAIAAGTLGESDADFQRDACASFVWRSKLPGLNDRDGLVHDRCLTPKAFEEAAAVLRVGLVDGDGLATAISAGWFSGLTWPLVKRIPLQAPPDDNWVLWLDVTEGCYWVNLNPVARNAAIARGNENYIAATRKFARHLPAYLASALRRLKVIRPAASDLGTLTDTLSVPEEQEIGEAKDQVLKPSIARFFNSRSSVSKALELSGPMAALAIGEFARVAHSRFYYHSTTPHQLDFALKRVADLLGWGSIQSMDPITADIGASVVPQSQAIAAIARDLASQVLAAQPPRNWRWRHIRAYHNAFARYVAFLVGLGIMGRARNSTILVGAQSASTTGLAGSHDKKTPSSKGATPVAICRQVREQLEHWYTHLQFLLERMNRCDQKLQVLRSRIASIIDGHSSSIVFMIDERGQPVSIGTTEAYGAVESNLRIKADSARHMWERFFEDERVDDTLADAQARHNVHWSDFWHETTRTSGARLRRVVGTLQERVLDELGVRALKGLVK